MFLIRLFTALIIAAPITYGLLEWHWSSVFDDAAREKLTLEVLSEHNLKEMPREGSDLDLQVQGEIDHGAKELVDEQGSVDLADGVTVGFFLPGTVLGLIIAFTGMLPWCREADLDHRISYKKSIS